MKQCSKCKRSLSLDSFAFKVKAKGIRQSQCNGCRKETAKESYAKHKETTIARSMRNNQKNADWLSAVKSSLKCCVCGEEENVCLDFHHIDPNEKEFEISMSIRRSSRRAIIKELNKCACLCANCHRKLHAGKINTPLVKLDIT
jgi:L-lysine 2,3-aminomutase